MLTPENIPGSAETGEAHQHGTYLYTVLLFSLKTPDFVKLAGSFGVKGYKIERAGEFEEVLRNAIKNDELAVIDVPVDYSENMELTRKLGPNICNMV